MKELIKKLKKLDDKSGVIHEADGYNFLTDEMEDGPIEQISSQLTEKLISEEGVVNNKNMEAIVKAGFDHKLLEDNENGTTCCIIYIPLAKAWIACG